VLVMALFGLKSAAFAGEQCNCKPCKCEPCNCGK
jgi:hypothetical protein